jgi:hypothetical protein
MAISRNTPVLKNATASSTTQTVTLGDTTTGSLLVCVVSNYNNANDPSGVADDKGNTFTKAISLNGSLCTVGIWYKYNCTGGSGPIITATFANAQFCQLAAMEISGIATGADPLDKTHTATSTGTSYTSGQTTTTDTADEFMVGAIYSAVRNTGTYTKNANWDDVGKTTSTNAEEMYTQSRIVSSTGTYESNGTMTDSVSESFPTIIATFRGGSSSTLDQEGFRFRNDDGSETTATWAAAQDTNLTAPAGTGRIRFILNDTGDSAAITPLFEYRHKPSAGSFGSWARLQIKS